MSIRIVKRNPRAVVLIEAAVQEGHRGVEKQS
jgi:hypothetical protein